MSTEADEHNDAATRPRTNRKFGVSDWMAVVAGSVLAIWSGSKVAVRMVGQAHWLVHVIADYSNRRYVRMPELWWHDVARAWSGLMWDVFQIIEALVLSITPAFLLIRLRPPRPPIRAMLKQPGTVAGLAVAFGYLWVAGWLHLLFFGRLRDGCIPAIAVGATVAIAWFALAASRKWTAEPTWVDRLGRLIGVAATAVGLLTFVEFGI
jgi:hypothetical protein